MEKQEDFIRDITEIRSMMERTTKFLSLSGWAGIMAGIYALVGAYLAFKVFGFNPDEIFYPVTEGGYSSDLLNVWLLGIAVLILSICTAIYFSGKKAVKRNEKLWNPTSRRLLVNMGLPLVVGGLLILVFILKGLVGLVIPMALIFYGFSLYIAGKHTYEDVKALGLIQIVLGLIGSYYTSYGLLLWAVGFGIAHIFYGAYIYFKYEK
jgi:hypothetical protein